MGANSKWTAYMLQANSVADRALASAVITLAALKRSRRLQQFCRRSDIQRRMPGFQARAPFYCTAPFPIHALKELRRMADSFLTSFLTRQ